MTMHARYIKPNMQVMHMNEQEIQFVFSPLEKGFGTPFANILRRVLLRYTPGISVTGLSFKGIDNIHPYTKVPGVREDVAEILSNLRSLLIVRNNDDRLLMHIEKRGPSIVLAKDLLHDEHTILKNPEHYICRLDSSAQVSVNIYGGKGYGFVPSAYHGHQKNIVFCDTIYTPVKHVSFHTRTYVTYEEIIFNVQTNGTCLPIDAVKNAFIFLNAKTDLPIIR